MKENYRLGKYLLETSHQLKLYLDAAFGDSGLNGLQARILAFVEYNDQQCKDVYQKDIEAEFKIRRSSVSSVLDTMEKNGFIRRVSVLSDARLKKLVLTDKARQVGEAHRNKISEFDTGLEAGLTEEELQTLKSLLARVIDNAVKMRGEQND
ncbi:MAG: winged helix-turn-helix transcriptional regulator [Oscillospiraceae bacterium]|nr:winged helix-turn-helix transcriptional regulator [Oscillospiraceae bacterium]